MALRTFWAILIKILGIYVILVSLTTIPLSAGQLSFFLLQAERSNDLNDTKILLIEIAYYILIIVIYLFILRICIFKTDWIINKLKLDKGFEDERLELKMHRSTILKIAIMIIGGVLIIDNFPIFCEQLLAYFRNVNRYKSFPTSNEGRYIVFDLLKIFIGFFMLTCSRMIVNYIELKQRGSVVEDSPGL